MADTFNKRFSSGDVFNIPYEANKQWNINSSSFLEKGITFNLGLFPTASNIKDYTEENLLYKSVLSNFYPEFYPTSSLNTSSYYQTTNYTSILTAESYAVSGGLRLGNLYSTQKYFPTTTSSYFYTINIPKSLYSTKILPTTFEMEVSGGLIYDDGEYNLFYTGSNQTSSIGTIIGNNSYVGNIFYEQGLGVLTIVPTNIIPPSVTLPPPPPILYTQEWVAIWFYDPAGTSIPWEVSYNYTVNGVANSFTLNQTSGFAGLTGVYAMVIRQDVGSGAYTSISGIPLTNFNTRVLTGTLGTVLATPNIYWDVFNGQEIGWWNNVSPTAYPPTFIPSDQTILGYYVYHNTLGLGVNFNRE